jgi:L-alanine-DL-glutamate epimerase-like enolase superfamily enzyme
MPYYTWGEVTDEAAERARGANAAEIMWDDSLGAGLQMAVLDAVGQLAGAPVWALLGEKVRTHAPVGWWAIDMPAEDWISECREAQQQGYTTFKTKARPWFDLEGQVAQLHEAVPDYFRLDLDFNDFGLDPAVARPLCRRLERYPQIAIWESPIQQEDVEGNRELRRQLSVPIAQHIGRPDFRVQLQRDICDGFVLEGGVSNAVGRGRTCAEFNKPFWLQWVGTNLAATFGLHLQAVLSHARWPAIHCQHMYAEQFVEQPLLVSNGMAEVPDRPGIGVSVDWDVVERHRVEPTPRPYPHPGLLLRLDWPSGATTYFTHAQQMWESFARGDLPAFVPGVNLVRVEDDGSEQWRSLQQQAQKQPVNCANSSNGCDAAGAD